MKSNIVIDILLLIPYLKEFLFSNYGPECCQPIKWQDSLKCNISRKKWMMEFIFSIQINREIFYKWILSFWMCVTRHAQSTQNMKFTYLCHISKNHGGWSWFLPCRYASKVSWNWYYHFRCMWSGMPILPKITSLLFFAIS